MYYQDFLFLALKSLWQWLQPWNQKMIASWQESYDKPRLCVEKQRHHSADEVLYSQGYSLPSGHIWLWELDHKEGRMPNNWCFQAVVLEKTPESSLDSKKIKPVNLKRNQPWTLIGRPHTEAAKSLQSCPTLCDPINGSQPGSPVPGILKARTLEWAAISFSNTWKWKVKVKLLSCVWPSATPWTAAFQAPPSMGFSRQEYWSGVPFWSSSNCVTW